LAEVLENLYSAAKDWYNLGLALGTSEGTLSSIESNNHDDGKRLRVMLTQRLSVTPFLTYSKICQCLRRKIVDRYDVADSIEKFCEGQLL